MWHRRVSGFAKSCVCKKTLVDKLIKECTSVVEENKIYNETLTMTSPSECASCEIYVVLFVRFLATSITTSSVFVYFYWHKKNKQLGSKKDIPDVKYSKTETMIY